MNDGVIFLVRPLLHSLRQARKRPHGLALWISRPCIYPRFSCGLSIAEQVVKHLRFQGPEAPFLRRPEARFSSRALMFADPVPGEQLLKVPTGKLWPAIDRNGR